MASIKYSALVSDHRGKLNGSVFCKNNSGLQIKNKQSPRRTLSIRQSLIRNSYQYLIKNFTLLTPAQQIGWNMLAAGISRINKVGNEFNPTGQQLYIGNNQNLKAAGINYISDAQPINIFPTYQFTSFLNYYHGPLWITVNFQGYTTETNFVYLIYVTKPLRQSITYVRDKYTLFWCIPSGTADLANLSNNYYAENPNVPSGSVLHFKIVPMDIRNGFTGQIQYGKAIVL